jgi:hypothetical protein
MGRLDQDQKQKRGGLKADRILTSNSVNLWELACLRWSLTMTRATRMNAASSRFFACKPAPTEIKKRTNDAKRAAFDLDLDPRRPIKHAGRTQV